MHKTIEYEVSYDLVAEIRYIGEEEPGEYYFRIRRHWADLIWDDEEDEAKALVTPEGKIEVEAYDGGYVRDAEGNTIEEMMKEILESKKI